MNSRRLWALLEILLLAAGVSLFGWRIAHRSDVADFAVPILALLLAFVI